MIYKIIIVLLLLIIIYLHLYTNNIEKFENIEDEIESVKDEIYKWKIFGINMTGCCNYNKEKAMCNKLKSEEECNIKYEKLLPYKNKDKKINEEIYKNSLKLYEKEYDYYNKKNKNNILNCEDHKKNCLNKYEKNYCINNKYIKISDCYKTNIKKGECELNGYIREDKCGDKGYITEEECNIKKNETDNINIQGCKDNDYMLITDCN